MLWDAQPTPGGGGAAPECALAGVDRADAAEDGALVYIVEAGQESHNGDAVLVPVMKAGMDDRRD
jgi:hypothetical protein